MLRASFEMTTPWSALGKLTIATAGFAVISAFPHVVEAATVRGSVISRDEGEGLPYATIRLLGTSLRAESGRGGMFLLRGAGPGWVRLGVSLVGYRPTVDSLYVAPADSMVQIRFELEPVAFALREVVVRADPRESAGHAQIISTEEIRRVPGTLEDLTRAVQLLPGLAGPDLSAASLVRGGESDETLVRLDGVDLLEPYHIRDWGGALSVVSLDATTEARLQRGGLPAQYGRQLSGALEIGLPPPDPAGAALRIGASLSQIRALVSGPMGRDASYLLGVRHGLFAALYRTHRFDPNADLQPDFQEAIAEIRLRPAERHEVAVLALAARDNLLYDEPWDENDIEGPQRNVTLGVRWSFQPSNRMRMAWTLSGDRFDRERQRGQMGRDDDLTRAIRARVDVARSLSGSQTLELGIGTEWEDARIHFASVDGSMQNGVYVEKYVSQVVGTARRRRLDGYLSLSSHWGSNLSTAAGIHFSGDHYDWRLLRDGAVPPSDPGEALASPRVSAALRAGRAITLRAAAGILRQPTFLNNLNIDRALLPLGRRRQAEEVIAGVDLHTAGATARLEGYLRRERGIGFPIQDLADKPTLNAPLDTGRSRGLEVYLQSPRWSWTDAWIGYALSSATWDTGEGVVPRSFDQPHALTVSWNLRPLAHLNVNATARYHSGGAYTRVNWVSPDGLYNWSKRYGPFMGSRYPEYFRLDLRATHPIGIGRPGGQVHVDLVNVTGRENVYFYTHSFEELPGGGFRPERETIELFPRVPYVGVELEF